MSLPFPTRIPHPRPLFVATPRSWLEALARASRGWWARANGVVVVGNGGCNIMLVCNTEVRWFTEIQATSRKCPHAHPLRRRLRVVNYEPWLRAAQTRGRAAGVRARANERARAECKQGLGANSLTWH